jgi:pyruvate formate lyase activating enzyme
MALSSLGLIKTSLIDFPGEVAAVLFTFGCNLRCPYCQNPALVTGPPPRDFISREEVRAFLKKRKDVLGGVCITGGEPLLHSDLGELIGEIKSLGLKVKLDTNGTIPERLREANVDYVAIDFKTSLEKYRLLTGTEIGGTLRRGAGEDAGLSDGSARSFDTERPASSARPVDPAPPANTTHPAVAVEESIRWIIESRTRHEIRTTVVPHIVTEDDIVSMIDLVRGAERWVLAGFRPETTLDPEFQNIDPYPGRYLEKLKKHIEQAGIPCAIRNAR